MRTDTANKIISSLESQRRLSPKQLAEILHISPQAVHRQLRKLEQQQKIFKVGIPPKVYYELNRTTGKQKEISLNTVTDKQAKLLEDFVVITPAGQYLQSIDAFMYWCTTQNLPFSKTAREYEITREKYDSFKIDGLIDGMPKMRKTFVDDLYIDEMYYLDFYSIERFGKTKLGQLMLYSKQSQNKQLMRELTAIAEPKVHEVIQQKEIEAICFVPPTIKREVQFMHEFATMLSIKLPTIKLEKIKTPIIVPQKTISKLSERATNAKTTLHIQKSGAAYNTVLLIDDAVGSGATMNYAAQLLKEEKMCKRVIGLAITGSYKGFEVIAEV